MKKIKSFKEFKKFLSEKCYDSREYAKLKYDKKIYDWFTKKIT